MSNAKRRKLQKRHLTVEPLEERQLLDAGGTLPTLAPLTNFASITAFDNYFLDRAVSQYSSLFGTMVTVLPWAPAQSSIAFPTEPVYRGPFDLIASPSSNPQVPGVGEGDIVQSDGIHLFVLSQNELVTLDKTASGALEIESKINVPSNPTALFLDGTRLTVISRVNPAIQFYPLVASAQAAVSSPALNFKPRLEVTVYDVSNAAAPQKVQDSFFDGAFVAARSVGDHLYLVIQNYLVSQNSNAYLAGPQIIQNNDGTESYETQAAYVTRITPQIPDLVLPHFYQPGSSVDNPVPMGFLSAPTDVYQGRFSKENDLVSVLTFDMSATGTGVTDVQTLLTSDATVIYATTDHLYLVSSYSFAPMAGGPNGSLIQRFDVQGNRLTPGPSGFVPILVSSQFDLDESNGYLRMGGVVPFQGDVNPLPGFEGRQSDDVLVLQQDGANLNLVGTLERFSTDTLSAVRFSGNKVYLATFQGFYAIPFTDPLFVVDLTDPTNPTLAGQVELAGREEYLQVLDNDHLLGLGENNGVELTLFNVSNSQHPSVIDQILVPGDAGYTWSKAQSNPQALSYSAGLNVLALPITGSRVSVIPNGDHVLSEDVVYQVNFQTGFHLVGSVPHDSQVERSVFQGTQFFTIADYSVKIQRIIPKSSSRQPPTVTIGASQEVRLTDNPRAVQIPTLEVGFDHTFLGSVLNFTVSDLTGLSATIDWGDGTTSPASILLSDNQRFSVGCQHTYAADGQYSLTIMFSRNGENAGAFSNSIQVGHVDPQIEYFLRRLYYELLNRNIDHAAIDYWAGDLSQGMSRAFVAQSVMRSAEYLTNQIQFLYAEWLHRPAEVSGLAAWIPFLVGGHSLDDVRMGILSSQEFFVNSGSTAGFVSALYASLFGRQADPLGRFAWQTVLQLGLTRQQVVTLMQHSHEAAVREVVVDFQHFLGRPAELDGLSFFSGAIEAGGSTQDIAAEIVSSQEFFQGRQGSPY